MPGDETFEFGGLAVRILHRFLPLCGLLALWTTSFAATITVNPPSITAVPNSTATVWIGFSNLDDLTPRALGAYDLQLAYDPSLLALNAVHFGDPVHGDQLDLSGYGTLAFADPSIPGLVRVLELSFDDASTLNQNQLPQFALAGFFFQTLGAGVSPLSIEINMVTDASGFPMPVTVGSHSFAETPEPAMFVLAGSGLGLLGLWGRRRRRREQTS